ncbi:protein DMP3-like [Physcomitrium patens]|uniref:protein DMP3-like n=1 Tax=Physcomitrium patens TaxID=3218 RepID=UPI003CCDFBBB
MSTVDTTTKLSYLLPTGTFLTFQVIAPLATNNGKCGVTEVVMTVIALAFLATGCILSSFTDSYQAPDGKVYNGFITRNGLFVPGYEAEEMMGENCNVSLPDSHEFQTKKKEETMKKSKRYIQEPRYKPMPTDYINAILSAMSFLTLTLFTDPVSTCFYPKMSDTLLKTLPVLLTALLSFFCTFSAKIRHGVGNSMPVPTPNTVKKVSNNSRITVRVDDEGTKH